MLLLLCWYVCFNRRIQDQFQLKKTENGIERNPMPTFHSMFGRPANALSSAAFSPGKGHLIALTLQGIGESKKVVS